MEIKIRLDIHAYAEEQLCDGCFDDPPFYGINGPEVMLPLSKRRNSQISFQYDENTSLIDFLATIKQAVWGADGVSELAPAEYAFLFDGERFYINDERQNFMYLLSKYIDPNSTGTITVSILVSCDAGDVGREGPLRFYVHSRESGRHSEAHIHVCDSGHQFEASIRISDGKIMAGKLPGKLAKLAKKKILSDQEYFYNCWNTMTDGLEVDINHHYGYIQY